MFDNVTNWLGRAHEESDGVSSSVRLQQSVVVLVAAVLPCICWAVVSIYQKELSEFPMSAAAFFGGLLGIANIAKQVQYPKEPANQQKPTEP